MKIAKGLAIAAAVFLATAGPTPGAVIFSDDFNTGAEPDPAKWTQTEDGSCSVYLTGGVLYAKFYGMTSPQYACATSPALDLPTGWTDIVLTGQWAFPTQGLGECLVRLHDPDVTGVYVQASYFNYPRKAWRGSYTGFSENVDRSTLPTALTDFTLTVTPTGWSFVTEGGSINKAYTTAHMAGLDKIQIRIGGWEYSRRWNEAAFDNIQLTPEPATLGLLALGGVAGLVRRKKRQ